MIGIDYSKVGNEVWRTGKYRVLRKGHFDIAPQATLEVRVEDCVETCPSHCNGTRQKMDGVCRGTAQLDLWTQEGALIEWVEG